MFLHRSLFIFFFCFHVTFSLFAFLNLLFFIIEYFQCLHIFPNEKIEDCSQANGKSRRVKEPISQRVTVVEPAVSFTSAGATPNYASAIDDVAEEDRARHRCEKSHQGHSKTDRQSLIALFDTSYADQEVTRSSGSADELHEAHNDQEDGQFVFAIYRARPRPSALIKFMMNHSIDARALIKVFRCIHRCGDLSAPSMTSRYVSCAIGAAHRRILHEVAMTIGIARWNCVVIYVHRIFALFTAHERERYDASD